MKRSKLGFLKAGLGGLFLIGLLTAPGYANDVSEDSDALVTQGWMRTALEKIESRLSVIEENQKKIIENQAKLSEEHTQLRYWIHRN